MDANYPEKLHSEIVRETVDRLDRLQDSSGQALSSYALVAKWAGPVFSVSSYLGDVCTRYPAAFVSLLEAGELESTDGDSAGDFKTWIESAWQSDSHAEASAESRLKAQLRILREQRHKAMLRILWRDLTGIASVDETLVELSNLADACIQMSWSWAHDAMLERFGEPCAPSEQLQRLVVLGMGKLGGRELNVSSDIDLIYIYPESGKTSGPRVVDNGEFFRRVAQRLTQLLGSVTEDGFVYRVDTRLRPFGDSGPLVMNLDGLEHYYLTQGRDWERYAMVKARPIAGVQSTCDEVIALLQPFIYRRYLDYNAIESLAELKRKIMHAVTQRGMERNIKLGAGGIREIEFTAQAFQLVRGGREPLLQARSLKEVLRTLANLGLLSMDSSNELMDAYDFLRRLENGLQLMRDQQVHTLPDDELDQIRLGYLMGFERWDELLAALSAHQEKVTDQFKLVFQEVTDSDVADEHDDAAVNAWTTFGNTELDLDVRTDSLAELGFECSEELVDTLSSLCFGGYYQRLTARGQERVDRIVPKVMQLALTEDNSDETLKRSIAFVRAVAGRSGYLQVLLDTPAALSRLVRLYSKSAWVAQFVTSHPIVIDELLTHDAQAPMPTLDEIKARAQEEAARLSTVELEAQMDGLRQFQKSHELRIAVAELEDHLPLMQVSDQLSWLAEAVVAAVAKLVMQPLLEKHGVPQCNEADVVRRPELGVVAYGKLGGIELGYGSDLDLVFVHNSAGTAQLTNGPKSIENSVFYARVAQKMVSFMNTMTSTGVLYDIDLRLRPNGQSGVLVTGLHSFSDYQQRDAWTWEHQALVRARMVMGGQELVARFERIRVEALQQSRDATVLKNDVIAMRKRIQENQSPVPANRMHLKQGLGGITDIEFMVQYSVLAKASAIPAMCHYTDNIRLLETMAEEQVLRDEDCEALKNAYIFLRALAHRQALQELSPVVALSNELDVVCKRVQSLWQVVFGEVRA